MSDDTQDCVYLLTRGYHTPDNNDYKLFGAFGTAQAAKDNHAKHHDAGESLCEWRYQSYDYSAYEPERVAESRVIGVWTQLDDWDGICIEVWSVGGKS